ncbi:MAG: DUF288 domain-containing protein [Desulfobacteraceae bacterium]|nr:MAG: DUF288 domain-containing protein [Desulfobacteraceae bacterium]
MPQGNLTRPKTSIVVTSISNPNEALRQLAKGSKDHGWAFIVIGDVSSPPGFYIDGCDFYDLDRQTATTLQFAGLCPKRHYARKNIGYLLAMKNGSDIIIDTDDDNFPCDEFWELRQRNVKVHSLESGEWVNVYRYFSDANIWPRGFSLMHIKSAAPALEDMAVEDLDCPIQQGLADENPDVDAIYRLILPLPLTFKKGIQVAFKRGTWCPFNSQNTMWWKDAFPLLYLPSCCSFRMTDIWRSFIAQRIAWENDWAVLFHDATVFQQRNEHNLLKDFADEIPGYLGNERLCLALNELPLMPGVHNIASNLKLCYEKLVEIKMIDAQELLLLDAWISDIQDV